MFTSNQTRSQTFRPRFRQTFARTHSLFHSRYSLTYSRYSLIHSRTFLTTFLNAPCARCKPIQSKKLRRWLRIHVRPESEKMSIRMEQRAACGILNCHGQKSRRGRVGRPGHNMGCRPYRQLSAATPANRVWYDCRADTC
jgi:hypothetical protein